MRTSGGEVWISPRIKIRAVSARGSPPPSSAYKPSNANKRKFAQRVGKRTWATCLSFITLDLSIEGLLFMVDWQECSFVNSMWRVACRARVSVATVSGFRHRNVEVAYDPHVRRN